MLLTLRWLLPLWLLGWLVLPVARRFFRSLPDGGLAAGRMLALALLCLFVFWGAACHLLPLNLAPLWLCGVPVAGAALALRQAAARADFWDWVQANRRALLASDAVFVGAFGFFLWVRLRHPEIADLEKSMDAAVMSTLARSRFLPPENPWLSGTTLSNYYYFGHLMAALLARTLATPIPFAYNLALPAFSALFIAPLWSLGAALTGSPLRGWLAMLPVVALGHFEPLRQRLDSGHWWPLDWWKTSRVIDAGNTINEYPIFTLTIGDAHAHFFAFALAGALLCVCYELFAREVTPRVRLAAALTLGALLGAMVMTNTWDVPLYGLLALFCAWPLARHQAANPPVARLVAWPLLHSFTKSRANGVVWEVWNPPAADFFLFWGGFLTLWVALLLAGHGRRLVPVAGGLVLAGLLALMAAPGAVPLLVTLAVLVLTLAAHLLPGAAKDEPDDRAARFRRLLALGGLGALLVQWLFYVSDPFFEGAMRHINTVFRFGLQGWILLGTAVACELASRYPAWRRRLPLPVRLTADGALAAFWIIPALCGACVVWTRTVQQAPRDVNGHFIYSLDGQRHWPDEDRRALDWLRAHAQPGDVVLEAVGAAPDGNIIGDYDAQYGRVAALTGVPAPLGWPQHVIFWGADWKNEIVPRWQAVRRIYAWTDEAAARDDLRHLGVRYIFVGDTERRVCDRAGLARLRAALPVVFDGGDTCILEVSR